MFTYRRCVPLQHDNQSRNVLDTHRSIWIVLISIWQCCNRCDPDVDDCPNDCKVQSTLEWSPLLNYIDISDQLRMDRLIDQPQRDSAAAQDETSHYQSDWVEGPNLGRDVHWTLRTRRQSETTTLTWDDEEIALFCSNFLVNSTVALECGHYLTPSVMTAIDICVKGILPSLQSNLQSC